MTRGPLGDTLSRDYYLQGGLGANGTFVESFARSSSVFSDQAAALVTQVMTSVAMVFNAGDVVTNLTFVGGATAAGTPTNWWVALYSAGATPALMAQSADQTSAAWAADAVKTLPLLTPQLITAPGVYYAGIMMKATTAVSLMCVNNGRAGINGAVISGMKPLSQSSGSALTAAAPATIATPTTLAVCPYCIAT
jgi:hypothetical protein